MNAKKLSLIILAIATIAGIIYRLWPKPNPVILITQLNPIKDSLQRENIINDILSELGAEPRKIEFQHYNSVSGWLTDSTIQPSTTSLEAKNSFEKSIRAYLSKVLSEKTNYPDGDSISKAFEATAQEITKLKNSKDEVISIITGSFPPCFDIKDYTQTIKKLETKFNRSNDNVKLLWKVVEPRGYEDSLYMQIKTKWITKAKDGHVTGNTRERCTNLAENGTLLTSGEKIAENGTLLTSEEKIAENGTLLTSGEKNPDLVDLFIFSAIDSAELQLIAKRIFPTLDHSYKVNLVNNTQAQEFIVSDSVSKKKVLSIISNSTQTDLHTAMMMFQQVVNKYKNKTSKDTADIYFLGIIPYTKGTWPVNFSKLEGRRDLKFYSLVKSSKKTFDIQKVLLTALKTNNNQVVALGE